VVRVEPRTRKREKKKAQEKLWKDKGAKSPPTI
jgi:hypothetical protein